MTGANVEDATKLNSSKISHQVNGKRQVGYANEPRSEVHAKTVLNMARI